MWKKGIRQPRANPNKSSCIVRISSLYTSFFALALLHLVPKHSHAFPSTSLCSASVKVKGRVLTRTVSFHSARKELVWRSEFGTQTTLQAEQSQEDILSLNSSIMLREKENECPKILRLVGKSTSAVVSFTFFAALAVYRNSYMISFFIGSIVNAMTGKILKRLLNQDRPEELQSSSVIRHKPDDKGMPSSHATSLGFIITFTILTSWRYRQLLPSEPVFWAAQPVLILYSIASLAYRIKAKLHTRDQVYVGAVLGTTIGILWFKLTVGDWPFPISLANAIEECLPADNTLPLPFLALPALVGTFVVGSFERRIKRWLALTDKKEK